MKQKQTKQKQTKQKQTKQKQTRQKQTRQKSGVRRIRSAPMRGRTPRSGPGSSLPRCATRSRHRQKQRTSMRYNRPDPERPRPNRKAKRGTDPERASDTARPPSRREQQTPRGADSPTRCPAHTGPRLVEARRALTGAYTLRERSVYAGWHREGRRQGQTAAYAAAQTDPASQEVPVATMHHKASRTATVHPVRQHKRTGREVKQLTDDMTT